MTQEDKILLLKDICTRLPYMPKIKITYQQQGIKGTDEGNVSCDFIEKIVNDLRNGVITEMQIYLRPISSMTEEELIEFNNIPSTKNYQIVNGDLPWDVANYKQIDWLNENHFDYRGLPKNLVIKVTEENNPYKE